jgi:hypothetical protein
MAWIRAIVLAPLVFVIVALWTVLQMAALLLRLAFAPVVWLSHQPQRQRVELRHSDARAHRARLGPWAARGDALTSAPCRCTGAANSFDHSDGPSESLRTTR